jgi:hypothetical protein
MSKICLRWAGRAVSLLLLGLAECGGTGDARSMESPGSSGASAAGGGFAGAAVASGGSGVAGSAPNACDAPSAANYEPHWTPPSPPMVAACTEQQAAEEWAHCEGTSAMFDRNACRAFDTDPANVACLGCMFGTLGHASAGAILVLPGSQWVANRAGCIALIDGDTSETGCGASTQAADICVFAACIAACAPQAPEADLSACENAAINGPCSAYSNKAACAQLPRYASCLYSNFSEYYNAMTNLFCVSGRAESVADGGAAGAGP